MLDKDEYKEEFKIYSNLCRNTYDASKPEVFEMGWENKYLSIIIYLDDMLRAAVRDESIENAKIELGRTLDLSVKAESIHEDAELGDYDIKVMETLNLSEIDTKDIKRKIDSSPYKNIEIQELRSFIEDKLEKLLEDNKTRISFAERYRAIIDNYNAGNSKNENFYEDLIDFVDEAKLIIVLSGGLSVIIAPTPAKTLAPITTPKEIKKLFITLARKLDNIITVPYKKPCYKV